MKTLFSEIYPLFKFSKDKPIKLFEAFSGIGCQKMALNRITNKVVSVGISEIDKFAIKSYKLIHGEVKNYGDITKINGKDLPEIDIFTWSFPCQDLSIAGSQKGLGEETRSGLGFEVIRIISEMKVKPKVLLMENVPDLITNIMFRDGWQKMQSSILKMGYMNYTEILNAKDYGVSQSRKRVFMVSILGNYSYEFPRPFKLKKIIKDYLENDVDEKYFLNIKTLNGFAKDTKNYKRSEKFKPHNKNDEYVWTITTKASERPTANYIIEDTSDCGMLSITTRPNIFEVIKKVKEGKLKVRQLTPRESFRFMGIEDKYFKKVEGKISNTQLYKQAGNGIVVDVLEYIFRKLF